MSSNTNYSVKYPDWECGECKKVGFNVHPDFCAKCLPIVQEHRTQNEIKIKKAALAAYGSVSFEDVDEMCDFMDQIYSTKKKISVPKKKFIIEEE
jgi:hypothetical protein